MCQNAIAKNYILAALELVRKLCAIKGMAGAKVISQSSHRIIHSPLIQNEEKGIDQESEMREK